MKPTRDTLCLTEYDLQHNILLPTFIENNNGYNFIRPIKKYLACPISDPVETSIKTTFSEIEKEILKKLPDTPTASNAVDYLSTAHKTNASYKDWISFTCRHTILLLNKAPSCPSLTKAQTSVTSQEMYYELLPMLKAANMTLQDLDIDLTGGQKDGRSLPQNTIISGK